MLSPCIHEEIMTEFSFWLDYPFKTFNFLSCNITPSYLLFYPHLFHLQLDLFETTQHFLELRDHLFDLFSYCSLALPLLAMFLQTRVPPRRPYFPLRSVHLQPIPECPGAAQLAGGHLSWEKPAWLEFGPLQCDCLPVSGLSSWCRNDTRLLSQCPLYSGWWMLSQSWT